MALWNFPFASSGAFLEFDVSTANLADFSDAQFVGNFTAVADGDQIINALLDFDLIDSTARYVRLTRITGLQAGSGLSEVAFGTSEIQCGAARGDVNLDGVIDLLDVGPFVDILVNSQFQCEADINADGEVTLLDVAPFVDLISGG